MEPSGMFTDTLSSAVCPVYFLVMLFALIISIE